MKASFIPAVVVATISCYSSGGLVIEPCQAAFVPTGVPTRRTNIRHTSGTSGSSSSSSSLLAPLYMEQLPKSLSEIELPDQLASVKDKLASTLDSSSSPLKPTPPPPRAQPNQPTPPMLFDPTNPETLISITKSFIATDLGLGGRQLSSYDTGPKRTASTASSTSAGVASATAAATAAAMPYGPTLLSSNLLYISSNNINDGRTGILTKEEYLASGRYFDLRGSFPDMEYRLSDFRVEFDESSDGSGGPTSAAGDGTGGDGQQIMLLPGGEGSTPMGTPLEKLGNGEITVRFTTRVIGTFRGAPLKLRNGVVFEPNGKVMVCPPVSTSITYSTKPGPDRGKIIKLVSDMVLDRGVGNTNGLSGIPAAAIVAGADASMIDVGVPPLVALGRFFGRPLRYIDDDGASGGVGRMAPFPESVLIQLAKGVLASNFGLNDPNLLAEEFVYLEPLMGPFDKEKYLQVFTDEYTVREGVPDLDYGLKNFRVDSYDPYRVWVDTRAKGTRTGNIGKSALPPNVDSASYEAPPESISFTFDDDGFCTRLTAAAVMDPLLGNTGGLGGVYGLLYGTGTPVTALKTRSLNGFLNRATKSLLSSVTGNGPNSWRLSDGRVVNGGGMLPSAPSSRSISLPSAPAITKTSALPPKAPLKPPAKPFFAAEATPAKQQRPTIALPKITAEKKSDENPRPPPIIASPPTKTIQIKQQAAAPIRDKPADPVTEALNSAFGIGKSSDVKESKTKAVSPNTESKAAELKRKAQAARAEAEELKKKAAEQKALESAKKQAEIDSKLEKQKQEQLKRQQLADEAARKNEALADEAARKKEAMAEEAAKKKKAKPVVSTSTKTQKGESEATDASGGGLFSFLKQPTKSSSPVVAKKSTPSPAPRQTPRVKSASTPAPSPATKAKTPKAKGSSTTSVKRSPTISLFGSSSKTKSTAKESSTEVQPTKKSPTMSIFGIGGPASTKPAVAKPKATTPKAKGSSTTPVKRSPTISLFGSSSKTKSAAKESSTKVQPRKKSPTMNIFGVGGGPVQTESPSKKKTSAKSKPVPSPQTSTSARTRSPTINLLKQSPKKATTTVNTTKKTEAKKSPTFSLFGGSSGSSKKDQQSVTSTQKAPSEKKGSASPSNMFGGFFGGSTSSSSGSSSNSVAIKRQSSAKKATSSKKASSTSKKPTPAKKPTAPKGVPVLKKWKQAKDKSIEGRIFGSSSFKDGVFVTTSPISKGKIINGSVVQTTSGSRYFLE